MSKIISFTRKGLHVSYFFSVQTDRAPEAMLKRFESCYGVYCNEHSLEDLSKAVSYFQKIEGQVLQGDYHLNVGDEVMLDVL